MAQNARMSQRVKRLLIGGAILCTATAACGFGFVAIQRMIRTDQTWGRPARELPALQAKAEALEMPFTLEELIPKFEPEDNMAPTLMMLNEAARKDKAPLDIAVMVSALQDPARRPKVLAWADAVLEAALKPACVLPNSYDSAALMRVEDLAALHIANNLMIASAEDAAARGDLARMAASYQANDKMLSRAAELEGDSTVLTYVRGQLQMSGSMARLLTRSSSSKTLARAIAQVCRDLEHPPHILRAFRRELVRTWIAAEEYPGYEERLKGEIQALGSNGTLIMPDGPNRLEAMRSGILAAWIPAFEAAEKMNDPETIGDVIDTRIISAAKKGLEHEFFLRTSPVAFGQTARSLRRMMDQRIAIAWAAEIAAGERSANEQMPPALKLGGYKPHGVLSSVTGSVATVSVWSERGEKPKALTAPGIYEDRQVQQSVSVAVRTL
jgi:hypothetical protein